MDTVARFAEQQLFFSTGVRQGEGVDAIDTLSLRPALLAPYRDLTRLRYDFPVVLVAQGPQAGAVRSLASVVDEVLRELAPRGIEGERLRKHVLRLEREIRTLLRDGAAGDLSRIWSLAAARLGTPDDPSAEEVLAHLGSKVALDGPVVDCDGALPARLVTHLWQAAQERKASAFRATVERLMVRLSDILRAAFLHSQAGQQAGSLRAALGGSHRDAFDFEAMSRLLVRTASREELAPGRRQRIEWVLDVLARQPFYADPRLAESPGTAVPLEFRFDNCRAASDAFRARLPAIVEVVKAIAIGELEAEGRYDDERDAPFFAQFDARALSAGDLTMFPDYLVVIAPDCGDAAENAPLMDVLSAGLPVRVLVETTDVLEEAAAGTGHFAFGVRSSRLANTATALGGVFVVQGTSSQLYALRERLARAMAHRGAALVSVYTGASASSTLPAYLTAAAATESRAFPAFAYDPYAGDNQAARFTLEDNPQPEADWPVVPFEYADADLQRVTEQTPFTIADFMLCDRRYADHFARVPPDRWSAALIPADEWLARDAKSAADAIPYVLSVDADDVLQRVIVDARLMAIAARCRTFWHRLQEQGGIRNSHAEILLARERIKWDEAKALEIDAVRAAAPTSAEQAGSVAAGVHMFNPPASAEETAAGFETAIPARDPDEAWIETARCPSCNECQLINDRMFRYNENRQAYIADIAAGTYRQLVEASEACQVAIIHPGKPRNADEPGLAELIERARPFI